jgi:hypothetical protein
MTPGKSKIKNKSLRQPFKAQEMKEIKLSDPKTKEEIVIKTETRKSPFLKILIAIAIVLIILIIGYFVITAFSK